MIDRLTKTATTYCTNDLLRHEVRKSVSGSIVSTTLRGIIVLACWFIAFLSLSYCRLKAKFRPGPTCSNEGPHPFKRGDNYLK